MSTPVLTELRWWAAFCRATWWRCKGVAIAWAALLLPATWLDAARVLVAVGLVAWLAVGLVVRFGHRVAAADFQRDRALRLSRERERRHIAGIVAVWPELMVRLGCSAVRLDGGYDVPGIAQYRWVGTTLDLVVPLPLGLTREHVSSRAAAIAENLGARSARTIAVLNGVQLLLAFGDALEHPFSLPQASTVDLRQVPMGRQEDGSPWTLRLGPHTLVAGASGSGKASLVWGLLLGLAPAIRSGLVQVHGIDLKSAMELGMGSALLTRFAATPEAAVQLLEEAVETMQARATLLAGTTRQHVVTLDLPHVVVLIDEMAALTAYQQDRDLLRRANTALSLLCSQGRAVGYSVFACLQDPRKETLPMRGLFTRTIGLRLQDALETAMVLGEGMRDKGALCHRIPSTMPGVGYLVPEDGGNPIRVRAGSVSDAMIRAAAREYSAPQQIPIVLPTDTQSEPAPRARRQRRATSGAVG